MRTFYEEWSPMVNRQQLADELDWLDMGVATFRLGEDAPEQYNRILPDTMGLNALIQDDE